ncbi:MAG: hypothetical protein C0459_06125 [Chitinophaga sp.]|jgi:hypothetical protein|nr:hypothetical protein [Chitinophaga sp.]
MNKKISTFKELIEEKEKLQATLQLQKQAIHNNLTELKTEIKPVLKAFNFLKQITSRNKENFLINSAVDLGTDLITKTGLLKKLSWPLRLALPFLIKNVSANFIAKKKEAAVEKP